MHATGDELNVLDNNMTLQESLYQLRSETQEAFDEAKALEWRWKDLEREQREVYQVRLILSIFVLVLEFQSYNTCMSIPAVHTPISLDAAAARNDGPRRRI